jgi:hypothetical protein
MAARTRRLQEEYVLEPGWIRFRFLPQKQQSAISIQPARLDLLIRFKG